VSTLTGITTTREPHKAPVARLIVSDSDLRVELLDILGSWGADETRAALADGMPLGYASVIVPPSEWHDVSCALTEFGSTDTALQFATLADAERDR
jgi:hypothetical protein